MRGQPEVELAIAWGMALAVRYDESLALLSELERDVSADHSQDQEAFRCEYGHHTFGGARTEGRQWKQRYPLHKIVLGRSADPWTANVASNVVRFGDA